MTQLLHPFENKNALFGAKESDAVIWNYIKTNITHGKRVDDVLVDLYKIREDRTKTVAIWSKTEKS